MHTTAVISFSSTTSRSRLTLSTVWSSRPYIRSMLTHSNPAACALRTKSTHICAECSRPHSRSTSSSNDCTPLDSLVQPSSLRVSSFAGVNVLGSPSNRIVVSSVNPKFSR